MRAESSTAARTGAFIAVTVALFGIQVDCFGLHPAPGVPVWPDATPSFPVAPAVLVIGVMAVLAAVSPERPPVDAYGTIPRSGTAVIHARSVAVMAVRDRLTAHCRSTAHHRLTAQGKAPPPTLRTPRPPADTPTDTAVGARKGRP
jgi:hypothetical protein